MTFSAEFPGCVVWLLRTLVMLAVTGAARADPVVVHNYDPREAATSGAVWAIAQASDGTLFVGSNRLSTYDGHAWETLAIAKAYAFRALAAAPHSASAIGEREAAPDRPRGHPSSYDKESRQEAHRVWVGAVGALGYVEKQATGKWTFVSLAPQLQAAGIADPGDVWQVHALGEHAVFITTDRVLRWDGHEFKAWLMSADPHLVSFSDGADVLVYQMGRGLWRVRDQGEPQLEIADALLPLRPVTWLSPLYRSANGVTASAMIGLGADAFRLTARLGGDGSISEPRFERLEGLTSVLRDIIPSYAEQVDSDLLAIGTYRAGVVLTDRHGNVSGRIDRATGLDDDNVTALRSDREGRVWIGHGSGFARVDGVGVSSFFAHRATFGSGVPRSVLAVDGQAFVLTSRGFFRVDAPSASQARPARADGERDIASRFVPLLEAEGMLHAAAVVDGQVWIGGFGGMWRITPDGAQQEYFSATDIVQVAPSRTQRGEILFLERYQLKMLRRTERGWASRALEGSVHDTPVSLLESDGDAGPVPAGVWVSTMTSGIYHFRWTTRRAGERPVLRLASHFQADRGLPPDTTSHRLALIGARLLAFTESGVLGLRPDGRGFDPLPEMAGFGAVVANPGPAANQARREGDEFWIGQARALRGIGTHALWRLQSSRGGDAPILRPADVPGLDLPGQITGAEIVRADGGSRLWIAGTEGVLRLDPDRLRSVAGLPRTRFLAVKTDERERPVLAAPETADPEPWEPGVRRVSFNYTTPAAVTGEPVFFQTRLAGFEAEWSPIGRMMSRELTGLRPGGYAFEVRAIDRFGRIGPPAAYRFSIASPWFVRWPALAAYGLGTVAAAGLVMRWRMVRLRRQNEKLNRLVAERTRELELSNTVRAEFLENVSHEIRNPLNGLNGLLGLLQQASLPPRERELMASLQGCARNLNRTYEEVLGFSRLEYGYITKDERRFRLRELLREVVDGLAWQAAQQGCRITIEGFEPGPEVEDVFIGDANKLGTIVTNFVGNALKYAPGQPVELTVELQPMAGDLVPVCIEVCDHGPGIPADEQGLIFQKFVRGSNAKAGKIAGTGLGLATCRVMAKALGGSVGVESEPGRGSVFFVRVPLRRAPELEPGAHPEAMTGAATGAESPAGREPAAALIVEDEAYNQTVLRGIVTQLGYEPVVAGTAAEAAAELQSRCFEVILLDWELPGSKGGAIARQVRAAPGGDRPVIVATTGHDSDEMRRRCRDAGMDDFVLKPYDLETIRRCITRVRHARAIGADRETAAEVPAVAGAADAPLNLRAFSHYAAGAPDKAREAARDFVAALDREMEIIEQATRDADGEQIAQGAHRSRALGGLLAATEFSEAARRLELLARAGTADQCHRAFRDLRAAGESLKRRLASHHQPASAGDA